MILDAGANAEATPAMLLQFAQMGAAFSPSATGWTGPGSALLSIGEEKSKGTPLVKETHACWPGAPAPASGSSATSRVGTSSEDRADVIVTDGFTGNVALKTLEGTSAVPDGHADRHLRPARAGRRRRCLLPHLLPLAAALDPESTGGAMLLGVDGVCVISHGSSSSVAMVNAITVAHDVAVGRPGGRGGRLGDAPDPVG